MDEDKNIAGNYYDKHHSNNPIVKFLMNSFHTELFSLIEEANPETLLDVGCGEGYTTKKVKRAFQHLDIKGVELEEEALKVARKDPKGIDFQQGNIYSLNGSKSYDVVMATEVLEHLEKPHKAIEETKRISEEYCIYTVPYEPFWRIANMARLKYLKRFGNTPGHINHWTKTGLRNLLSPHFDSVKIRNCYLWNMALCKKRKER